jgi:periplasmic protein TonB
VTILGKITRSALPVWGFGIAAAAALHIGAAGFAIETMRRTEPSDTLGARAIDIGIEVASPRGDVSELPPGPDTDASSASPEMVEQKAELKETSLPQAKPTDTDDPDRVVSPNEAKKPTKEDPKITASQSVASRLSVAAEATAMPTSNEAKEAPRSTAPAQGIGESAQRVRLSWQKELVAHFDHHKRYPANRPNKAAEIMVRFTIDRTGHVLNSEVIKSSGDVAFDAAALGMVQRSDPVPPPPPLVADESLTFSLPVVFRAKKGT